MIRANIYQTVNDWLKDFSKNLNDAMIDAHYTQMSFSRETGIPQSSLSRYLQGTRVPSIEDVITICDVLEISVDEMINYGFYIL